MTISDDEKWNNTKNFKGETMKKIILGLVLLGSVAFSETEFQ